MGDPSLPDTDKDGVSDICDACLLDPTNTVVDGDGNCLDTLFCSSLENVTILPAVPSPGDVLSAATPRVPT